MVLMRYCSRWGEALRCGGALTKERLSTEERLCGAVLLSLGEALRCGTALTREAAMLHGTDAVLLSLGRGFAVRRSSR